MKLVLNSYLRYIVITVTTLKSLNFIPMKCFGKTGPSCIIPHLYKLARDHASILSEHLLATLYRAVEVFYIGIAIQYFHHNSTVRMVSGGGECLRASSEFFLTLNM